MRRYRIFGFLFLLLVPFLTSCHRARYTYQNAYVRTEEPYGTEFVLNGAIIEAVVGDQVYEFEATVPIAQREAFIDAQEELNAYLKTKGLEVRPLTYRVLPDYPNRSESEADLAYYGVATHHTQAQIVTTLQALWGDYVNYGYLYGLSGLICNELGWTPEEKTAVDSMAFMGQKELLNLVYPCFDTAYTAKGAIQACKDLSLQIVAAMERPFAGAGEGEAAFRKGVLRYAEEEGYAFIPSEIRFAYNGRGCPLKIRTQYLEVFKDSTYIADPLYRLGYLGKDYFTTVNLMTTNLDQLDQQIAELHEKFGVAQEKVISVQMMDRLPEAVESSADYEIAALYYEEGEVILCRAFKSALHEYIHYLYSRIAPWGSDAAQEAWQSECLAYYYALPNEAEEASLWLPQTLSEAEYKALMPDGHLAPETWLWIRQQSLLERDETPLYQLKTANTACAAFADYFIGEYGEEAFCNSMFYPSRVKEFTDCTMEQILTKWQEVCYDER